MRSARKVTLLLNKQQTLLRNFNQTNFRIKTLFSDDVINSTVTLDNRLALRSGGGSVGPVDRQWIYLHVSQSPDQGPLEVVGRPWQGCAGDVFVTSGLMTTAFGGQRSVERAIRKDKSMLCCSSTVPLCI